MSQNTTQTVDCDTPFKSKFCQEHPSILTVIVLCLMGLALAALAEIGAAFCLSAMQFFLYGLAWTVAQLPFLLYRASLRKTSVTVLFWAVLLVLFLVPWNSRKVFLNDFDQIRVGMDKSEVEALMSGYIEGTGWPALSTDGQSSTLIEIGTGVTLITSATTSGELKVSDALVYRHSETADFNSDWGLIHFKNGKVTAKVFMPD
jgi:hypothetical protein